MVCRLPAKKTCSRCGKAKYCSAECQRSHWKEHKVDCKAGPATQQGGASEPAACTSPTGPGVVIDLSSQPADKTHALAVSLHQPADKMHALAVSLHQVWVGGCVAGGVKDDCCQAGHAVVFTHFTHYQSSPPPLPVGSNQHDTNIVRSLPDTRSAGFKTLTYMRWMAGDTGGLPATLHLGLNDITRIATLARFRMGLHELQAVSKAIAAKPTNNAGLLPNVHGSEFFLIKVQTPVRPTDPILIYDKQRSFTLPLCIEQVDAHKSLAAAVIASRNPVKKAYMWAKRESDMELRVYTDARDLPSQTGNAVSW
ncbi:hypothetical protein FOA52_009732 [Chlamydomonas sp. UWO 241]|nr:hypothetical protein FOA52_009732 [Chlamydomonas sp. UWO 241]